MSLGDRVRRTTRRLRGAAHPTTAGGTARRAGAAWQALQRLPGVHRGRPPGVRTAKTVLAATAAYLVARVVSDNPRPVLAPLTALLVVQLTLYETVRSGARRVLSVVAGVLLALAFSVFVGFSWWSLAVLIGLAIVVGRLLRVGEQLLEVPISAMLVLAVSDAQVAALGRLYETLLGAGVGVAVNAVVAPPLYLQPAGDAIRELADRLAGVLDTGAAELRTGWSHDAAVHWLDDARGSGAAVLAAQRAFGRAEQSLRLNPRRHRFEPVTPSLRAALASLEHAAVLLRGVMRSLADRAAVPPEPSGQDDERRAALGDVLAGTAGALRAFGEYAAADVASATGELTALRSALDTTRAKLDAVGRPLAADPLTARREWQLHGSLLTDIERLLGEIDPQDGADAKSVARVGRLPRRPPDVVVREAVDRARDRARQLRDRERGG